MVARLASLFFDRIFSIFGWNKRSKDALTKRTTDALEPYINDCAKKSNEASKRGLQKASDHSIRSSGSIYNRSINWFSPA